MQNYNNEEKRKEHPRHKPYGGENRNNDNQSKDLDMNFKTKFDSSWITNEAKKELVEYAKERGEYMAKNNLTNTKIRNIYGEIKRIQMSGFEKEKPSFYLLKPKVAYALGRDKYNKGLELFKVIFDKVSDLVTDTKTYQNFCNLMEAVLAYHKAYGGKD